MCTWVTVHLCRVRHMQRWTDMMTHMHAEARRHTHTYTHTHTHTHTHNKKTHPYTHAHRFIDAHSKIEMCTRANSKIVFQNKWYLLMGEQYIEIWENILYYVFHNLRIFLFYINEKMPWLCTPFSWKCQTLKRGENIDNNYRPPAKRVLWKQSVWNETPRLH